MRIDSEASVTRYVNFAIETGNSLIIERFVVDSSLRSNGMSGGTFCAYALGGGVRRMDGTELPMRPSCDPQSLLHAQPVMVAVIDPASYAIQFQDETCLQ